MDRQGEDVDVIDDVKEVLQACEQIQHVHEGHDEKEKAGGMSTKFPRAEREDREKTAGVPEQVDDDARAGDEQAKAGIVQMQWRTAEIIRAREIHASSLFSAMARRSTRSKRERDGSNGTPSIYPFLPSLSFLSFLSLCYTFVSVKCRRIIDS